MFIRSNAKKLRESSLCLFFLSIYPDTSLSNASTESYLCTVEGLIIFMPGKVNAVI